MEFEFLNAIAANPSDDDSWLVFADWLEERGDERADYVRLCLLAKYMAPDDLNREQLEQDLGRARSGVPANLVQFFEPNLRRFRDTDVGLCGCDYESHVEFHDENQETECQNWGRVCDLVETAAEFGHIELKPKNALSSRALGLVTLPATIGRLKKVQRLVLYGSQLTRIPPEIGQMENLTEFIPYTSYQLHWFPFELTHCSRLTDSAVSTRAVYGNYKNRMNFPDLTRFRDYAAKAKPYLQFLTRHRTTRPCSVCRQEFEDRCEFKVWTSGRVATDVLPLLVNACSQQCLDNLPQPPSGYHPSYHQGGADIQQPDADW